MILVLIILILFVKIVSFIYTNERDKGSSPIKITFLILLFFGAPWLGIIYYILQNITNKTINKAQSKTKENGKEVICLYCNTKLSSNDAICPYCGRVIERCCVKCGTNLKDSWLVCPTCGTNTYEEKKLNPINMDNKETSFKKIMIMLIAFVIGILILLGTNFYILESPVEKEVSVEKAI
jgi:RNA polymerase subunit RPABC4/transcription elongation factor Spt4